MLATIIDMQINKKPYSITLVPLYDSLSNAPMLITVSEDQSMFVLNNCACGNTIEYNTVSNVLSNPPSTKYPRQSNYDTMLVENMRDTVDKDGDKCTKVRLFGKNFGCLTIEMYNNRYSIRQDDKVLVWNTANKSYSIVQNLSLENRRRDFLAKTY